MSTGACRWAFSPSIGPTNRANYPRLSADGALERGDMISPKAEQRLMHQGQFGLGFEETEARSPRSSSSGDSRSNSPAADSAARRTAHIAIAVPIAAESESLELIYVPICHAPMRAKHLQSNPCQGSFGLSRKLATNPS